MTPTDPPSGTSHPLEPSEELLRQWFTSALDHLFEHLRTLPDQPASNVDGAVEEALGLDAALGEQGTDALDLIRTLIQDWIPRSFNTAGPGYLAYIPGGGIPLAGLADLISDLTNRYVGVFAAAPLLVRLEVVALRFLMDEFGYPSTARGVFLGGGSMANFTAVVCARHKLLGEQFLDGVVYYSDQVHHCVEKASRLAGFPSSALREVETGPDGRLRAAAVREAVARDRAAGLRPALLVASAGTVNTGAVDPLAELADLAAAEGLWFHVDAAYGGVFQLTRRGRTLLQGIDRADSITVDPHKGLFLPYGTGCLLVRDGEDLRAPHASSTDYLPAMQDDPRTQDFCEYSMELSRDARGLRVWLPLRILGVQAFRDALDEKLDLARRIADAVREMPELRLVHEPELSLVSFRVAGDESGEPRTRALLERINQSERVWISGSKFEGRFIARMCVLHFRTHADRIEEAIEILRDAAREVVARPVR